MRTLSTPTRSSPDLSKVKADSTDFEKCEDYTVDLYTDVKTSQNGSVVTIDDNSYYLADSAKIMLVTVDKKGKYDEVKTVTAKKLVKDYETLSATVTGVLDSDGNFTYLFVDLH